LYKLVQNHIKSEERSSRLAMLVSSLIQPQSLLWLATSHSFYYQQKGLCNSFICGLLNTLIVAQNTQRRSRMVGYVISNELERIWKEEVVA
jgi:hypothetical protein